MRTISLFTVLILVRSGVGSDAHRLYIRLALDVGFGWPRDSWLLCTTWLILYISLDMAFEIASHVISYTESHIEKRSRLYGNSSRERYIE